MKQITYIIIFTIASLLGYYMYTTIAELFNENTQNNDNFHIEDALELRPDSFNLDSIEKYDCMLMDSLDKESNDWTGTTQGH